MAANPVLVADWDATFQTAGATIQDKLPRLGVGDYVYRVSTLAQSAGQNKNFVYKPYKITGIVFKTSTTGTRQLLDSTGATAAPTTNSDTYYNAAVSGGHIDALKSPAFYNLIDANNVTVAQIHQSDLALLTEVQSFATGEIGNWTDPTF